MLLHLGTQIKVRIAVPTTAADAVVKELTVELGQLDKEHWNRAFDKICELRAAADGRPAETQP